MEQVRKATEIITHLRTFGRPAPVALEPVEVHDVISRSLSLVHEQLRMRAIEVTLDLYGTDLIVLGNPIQLEQVFINLLTNARDALADAERREVCVSSTTEGDTVKITFADTGAGIPPELAQRIFDPFFTTKEVGGGTGLGLSITYSIVKEHGGEIWVEGRPGEGAIFHIELPVAGEQPDEEAAA
jgi:C4-dicarboxylate-specific signal transduction histidine kinase